jgi:Zn-finger nucleic acid-binding protein
MFCPDCKIEMEFIVPDDSENYYKCPKCKLELTEDDE